MAAPVAGLSGGARGAQAKIVVPRRKVPDTYEGRKKLRQETQRIREEKGDERNDALGPLVTLPKGGIQYREVFLGEVDQPALVPGDACDIAYTVYRLSSGAYFKYSSGGTPVYLWSYGYGNEGQDDVGQVFSFSLGDRHAVPVALAAAMEGMHPGGVRRVLVPPELGWRGDDQVRLVPETFGGRRRLINHKEEPLLVDVELMRVKRGRGNATEEDLQAMKDLPARDPFSLPAPPQPFAQTQQ